MGLMEDLRMCDKDKLLPAMLRNNRADGIAHVLSIRHLCRDPERDWQEFNRYDADLSPLIVDAVVDLGQEFGVRK
jgi:hypothetical protein